MEYVWIQDSENKHTHAFKFGNKKTFCLKSFNEDFKYKSLHDFTAADKCPVCLEVVGKIYRGVMCG